LSVAAFDFSFFTPHRRNYVNSHNKTVMGEGTAVPTSSTSASHQALTRRVRLIKQHIHAGLPKGPGEEIELLQDLADWLVAEGAAQEIGPAVNVAPTSSPAATHTTISTPPATPKKEK
jgi:hypothetical protein